MLSRLKDKVKRMRDLVNTYVYIENCISRDGVDISKLLRLLNIEVHTRIEISRSGSAVYLLVYQRGTEEPDYTIKLRSEP